MRMRRKITSETCLNELKKLGKIEEGKSYLNQSLAVITLEKEIRKG